MSLVVLLRGVNVGGHRTFRPALLAKQLADLDVVNIGAAGTFVVRSRAGVAKVRAEFVRLLPFETAIVICQGREFLALWEREPFRGAPAGPDIVPFVSVLVTRPKTVPSIPYQLPSSGTWDLRLLARDGPFVLGMYRRHMKAIGHLGTLDKLFGVPVTTRNWNTVGAIVRVLTP